MLKNIFVKLIGNAIVQAGRAIKMYNIDMFATRNFSITPEQYVVLSMLSEDNLLHQNELCKELYKDKSNMTRILSVLEGNNLIEKIHGIENKKQVNKIKITQKGKELKSQIEPFMADARAKYLEGLSEDDMYTCLKVLSKIQENLLVKE